jgi:hypothetical protein
MNADSTNFSMNHPAPNIIDAFQFISTFCSSKSYESPLIAANFDSFASHSNRKQLWEFIGNGGRIGLCDILGLDVRQHVDNDLHVYRSVCNSQLQSHSNVSQDIRPVQCSINNQFSYCINLCAGKCKFCLTNHSHDQYDPCTGHSSIHRISHQKFSFFARNSTIFSKLIERIQALQPSSLSCSANVWHAIITTILKNCEQHESSLRDECQSNPRHHDEGFNDANIQTGEGSTDKNVISNISCSLSTNQMPVLGSRLRSLINLNSSACCPCVQEIMSRIWHPAIFVKPKT